MWQAKPLEAFMPKPSDGQFPAVIIVFGRSAGQNAAAHAKDVVPGRLTLEHISRYDAERKEAGIETEEVSPRLLPDYRRKVNG